MPIAPWHKRLWYSVFPPMSWHRTEGVEYVTYGPLGLSPIVGDWVVSKMESGKYALLRITKIDTPSDPGDQHFFKYEFYRYMP